MVIGVERWVGKCGYTQKLSPIFSKHQQQHKLKKLAYNALVHDEEELIFK